MRLTLPGQLELPQTSPNLAGLVAAKAKAPLMAPVPQRECDIGLFSDAADQTDLIEMLMQPLDQ